MLCTPVCETRVFVIVMLLHLFEDRCRSTVSELIFAAIYFCIFVFMDFVAAIYFCGLHIKQTTVIVISFRTDKSGQTVQTQIRLLLEEQSDQGLHCLLSIGILLN